MSIIVSNIRIPVNENKEEAFSIALKQLKIESRNIEKISVAKVSVDARHKDNISLVYNISVKCDDEENVLKKSHCKNAILRKINPVIIPDYKGKIRPVIIGFGPAGIFAGLTLARAGARPIILERGLDVDSRTDLTEKYWQGGTLSTTTNVQFGEGGAGTFSDGKLTCRINDPLCDYIIDELSKHGAPNSILISSKPHIGTDILRSVVKNIRNEIIELGGEVHFNSKVDEIIVKNGSVVGVKTLGMDYPCNNCVVAIGHSARDTFAELKKKGMTLLAKPFSVGFRVEHLKYDLNESQYGDPSLENILGPSDYQLSYKSSGRCTYTFCMCPGGFVVPSENEEGTIVTNGMSYYDRNNRNSNSAVVCSVSPEDFDYNPFNAISFQEKIEHDAFQLGNGKAPCSTVGSFFGINTAIKRILPSYYRGTSETNLKMLYPKEINDMLIDGLKSFGTKIKCFTNYDAVLTGPETRTSSPIRIVRNENSLESIDIKGFYPCAEGAGYAGGIVSAAVDGVKCALQMIEKSGIL